MLNHEAAMATEIQHVTIPVLWQATPHEVHHREFFLCGIPSGKWEKFNRTFWGIVPQTGCKFSHKSFLVRYPCEISMRKPLMKCT